VDTQLCYFRCASINNTFDICAGGKTKVVSRILNLHIPEDKPAGDLKALTTLLC